MTSQSDIITAERRQERVFATIFAALITVLAFFTPMRGLGQVNTDQMVNIGRNAMYFEDYVLSIQYFNQAIKAKPYLARPYLYRAIAKINLDDYRGAEADATLAIERNPYITDAWEVRGVARQNLGDNKGAVADYSEALRLLPHNRQISFNLATAQTEAGMYGAADSTFRELLEAYPNFDNGLLGRARLRLASADTTAAVEDIRKALSINPNSFNGHAMLSDLALRGSGQDADSAMTHLNAAIKLQPHFSGLYVNRAYLKYKKDDWFGAMADYDYALELDPLNSMAMFNRGLLEMEASANDKALEDFNRVLSLDPDDFRARYNRAVIYSSKRDFRKAIEDINSVLKAQPDFANGFLMRSEMYRSLGNMRQAIADYDHGMALMKKLRPLAEVNAEKAAAKNSADGKDSGNGSGNNDKEGKDNSADGSDLMAQRQFAALLTVSDNTDFREEYNNSAIRGRIQDRNITVETEPIVELTFYTAPTEVRPNTYFIKEVDDINSTRALRMTVFLTTHAPQLNDVDFIDKHFKSIEYYNSYIATHTPRAIDYFGRALDLVTVRDYDAAIADLNRCLDLTPDFTAAYMLRAQARWRRLESDMAAGNDSDEHPSADKKETLDRRAVTERSLLDNILADLDNAIRLSPRNPYLRYNRGIVLLRRGDTAGAYDEFTQAISLKPDFGEAYFNRGYVSLSSGVRRDGLSDLSRAGELGVVGAYNLMKRLGGR